MATLIIQDNANIWPRAHAQFDPLKIKANELVEKFQRNLGRMGHPTGVTWVVLDTDLVGSLSNLQLPNRD